MSRKILDEIRAAEDKAERQVVHARQDAERMIRKAEQQAKEDEADAEREMKSLREHRVVRARDEAAKEVGALRKDNEKACKDLSNAASSKLDEAVRLIKEGVLKEPGGR